VTTPVSVVVTNHKNRIYPVREKIPKISWRATHASLFSGFSYQMKNS